MTVLWARACARNKKIPLPFSMGQTTLMDDYVGNQKLTVWNKTWWWHDNVTLLSLILPGLDSAGGLVVCRLE
eukprot:CAMPEP_0185905266 /NCGR_PEP_ID=MMETSP0196C-20130402/4494_1 /TAXON_ID=2932 /ORGANISM="Alexandrium fundyense, Strain CCMP1719" /LENGTH=71 /DNA_ID=CAMNT_0028624757 /DNA_START=45 /DNA_END=257 /DNA_ORIENTATION=+